MFIPPTSDNAAQFPSITLTASNQTYFASTLSTVHTQIVHFPAAGAGRIVVVGYGAGYAGVSGVVTSATIGGVAATVAQYNSGSLGVGVISAPIGSGISLTVQVTFSQVAGFHGHGFSVAGGLTGVVDSNTAATNRVSISTVPVAAYVGVVLGNNNTGGGAGPVTFSVATTPAGFGTFSPWQQVSHSGSDFLGGVTYINDCYAATCRSLELEMKNLTYTISPFTSFISILAAVR